MRHTLRVIGPTDFEYMGESFNAHFGVVLADESGIVLDSDWPYCTRSLAQAALESWERELSNEAIS